MKTLRILSVALLLALPALGQGTLQYMMQIGGTNFRGSVSVGPNTVLGVAASGTSLQPIALGSGLTLTNGTLNGASSGGGASNVANVDLAGNDSTATVGGTPFATDQAAFNAALATGSSCVIHLGVGTWAGITVTGTAGWPSNISISGEGNNTSFVGGISTPGTNLTITSNNVNLGSVSANGILGGFYIGFEPAPGGACSTGSTVWATNAGASTVTELSLSGSIINTFSIGSDPQGICFDGTHLWMTNMGNNTVTEFNTDGSVVGNFSTGNGPQFICSLSSTIWITNLYDSTVTELSAVDGSTLGTTSIVVDSSDTPAGICTDGTNIWMVNQSGSELVELSGAGSGVMGGFSLGSGSMPTGI